MSSSLLDAVVAASTRSVEVRQRNVPLSRLETRLTRPPLGTAFHQAVRQSPPPRVVAECKRRSPSGGILRRAYDPAALARAYARAGAAAVSVLTEPTFFDGSPEHLEIARAAVDLPLLRKDFLVTEYQLVEAAALGADAVLLIVAALSDTDLRRLIDRAAALGLAALVEVHSVAELHRALDAGATLVGVNSRNLRTLAVDPAVFDAVLDEAPASLTVIAESGIRGADDLQRLSSAGYHGFLVGERLVTRDDPGAALRELRGQ